MNLETILKNFLLVIPKITGFDRLLVKELWSWGWYVLARWDNAILKSE